jgi:aspartyl-tRNA(Asn)/glutamyl-tRNA(Gln) amidotransferase subunit C
MFSKDYVKKQAQVVGLTISDEEAEKLTQNFEQTLKYMNLLNELDTSDVKPTYQTSGNINVFQDKSLNTTLLTEDVLQNAHNVLNNLIASKGVLIK